MSVRITQGMLYARALSDVQRGLFRYSQLQQQVATGRRVSRPSDDPAATLRILPLRSEIRNLEQQGENAALARETLDTATSSLEEGSALMQRVRELITQASNGTLNQGDRETIGAEVDQLLDQLLGIANSRRGDRFLFGGTENATAPFELVTAGGRTRAVYHGNRDTLSMNTAPGVSTEVNLPGERIFLLRDRGATTFTATFGGPSTGAAPIGFGDTGIGQGRLDVTFGGLTTDAPPTVTAGSGTTTALGPLSFQFTTGPDTLSVGGGPAVPIPVTDGTFTTADGLSISLTVSGVPATTNGTFTSTANLSTDGGQSVQNVTQFTSAGVAVTNSFDGTVLYVDTQNLTRTGSEDVEFEGTYDAFTTLATLRDLLRNDEGLPPGVVRDRVANLLPKVDGAHDALLDGLRELGFRSSSMDVLRNRVEGLRIQHRESLSRIEDTDLAESILELQRQDLSYQAALQVSARVIQTSLQGFLR